MSRKRERKREVQPDTMADDFGRESMTAVHVGLSGHGRIIPNFVVLHQPSIKLTIPKDALT